MLEGDVICSHPENNKKNVELQGFRQQGAVEMRGALFTVHYQC